MTMIATQSSELVSELMKALREDKKVLDSGKVPVAISRVTKKAHRKVYRKPTVKK